MKELVLEIKSLQEKYKSYQDMIRAIETSKDSVGREVGRLQSELWELQRATLLKNDGLKFDKRYMVDSGFYTDIKVISYNLKYNKEGVKEIIYTIKGKKRENGAWVKDKNAWNITQLKMIIL